MVLPYFKMNLPQVYMCSPSWTLLPPPSPFHPSGSSQCTSPKHPVSSIEPGLATCFIHDSIHVSKPFYQIFPPSPSPTESIRLFYTSVSLLQFFIIKKKYLRAKRVYTLTPLNFFFIVIMLYIASPGLISLITRYFCLLNIVTYSTPYTPNLFSVSMRSGCVCVCVSICLCVCVPAPVS